MVVGFLHQRWHDGYLHFLLFVLFLLPPKWNVRVSTDVVLLWIHGSDLFRLLPHAGFGGIPVQLDLRQVHLLAHQERLAVVCDLR